MTTTERALRDVVTFAYEQGYHEHGVDLVNEFAAELRAKQPKASPAKSAVENLSISSLPRTSDPELLAVIRRESTGREIVVAHSVKSDTRTTCDSAYSESQPLTRRIDND
jgi:hypothetical protein